MKMQRGKRRRKPNLRLWSRRPIVDEEDYYYGHGPGVASALGDRDRYGKGPAILAAGIATALFFGGLLALIDDQGEINLWACGAVVLVFAVVAVLADYWDRKRLLRKIRALVAYEGPLVHHEIAARLGVPDTRSFRRTLAVMSRRGVLQRTEEGYVAP